MFKYFKVSKTQTNIFHAITLKQTSASESTQYVRTSL